MKIFKLKDKDSLTLILEGEINTATAPELEKVVKESLNNISTLIFDFSKVEYVSSAGLRILLIAKKAIGDNGKLIVKNINETVKDILEMTGFSNIIDIE